MYSHLCHLTTSAYSFSVNIFTIDLLNPDKECLKKAIKNKGLEKTLKISGIGEEIYSQLEKELGEINE